MELRSLKECRLAIGSYPQFDYDGSSGGGVAKFLLSKEDNIQLIDFLPEKFSIPPISRKTTKILGISLPPGLKISMNMEKLGGTIQKNTGEILLDFESRFTFTIGSIIRFPDLIVKTCLQTGMVKGKLFEEEGLALQKDGQVILVGVAVIPITNNKFIDILLGLPNEALAVLKCKLE